ncbi:MAG TPA: carboxymuconolactone decarboxylase family protein [Sphingobium sp.]|nr:carboxymuconolactone decarboxylase family protein [Sphingobium sp.]
MNALTASPLLRLLAPKSLAGYARFREVIDKDGALPASIKGLFVAIAATTKGFESMAQRELARAHGLGLTSEEASAGAIILCSVRGEGAALRYIQLLQSEYPETIQTEIPLTEIAVAPGEARDNFLGYFGSMPPSLGKLIDHLPVAADAYYLMRQGTLGATAIGSKFAELLLVTVIAADYSPLVAVHAKGAVAAGASEAELYEAILCAVPTSGLSAWVAASNAIDEAAANA